MIGRHISLILIAAIAWCMSSANGMEVAAQGTATDASQLANDVLELSGVYERSLPKIDIFVGMIQNGGKPSPKEIASIRDDLVHVAKDKYAALIPVYAKAMTPVILQSAKAFFSSPDGKALILGLFTASEDIRNRENSIRIDLHNEVVKNDLVSRADLLLMHDDEPAPANKALAEHFLESDRSFDRFFSYYIAVNLMHASEKHGDLSQYEEEMRDKYRPRYMETVSVPIARCCSADSLKSAIAYLDSPQGKEYAAALCRIDPDVRAIYTTTEQTIGTIMGLKRDELAKPNDRAANAGQQKVITDQTKDF